MEMVSGIVFVCLFLIGLCAIEHYFRFSRLPYISWVVLFGVGYGLLDKTVLPQLPGFHLTPDVILYVFLPVLIFDSSRKLDPGMVRKEGLPAAVLAAPGIMVSMFVMALPIWWLTDLPWVDVLFFTAIMSATDPVAVSAIFSAFPIPGKLRTLVEGESLLNDGTTVILFILLSGRVLEGKELGIQKGLVFFVLSVAGAVLLGGAAGWGGIWLIRKWKALKDHFIAPLLPLIVVYLVFCAAQAGLDISGVIAGMAATMTMRIILLRGGDIEKLPQRDVEFYGGFWDFLGSLANAALFFMLGVEMGGHGGEIQWMLMPVVIGALLLSRSVVAYGFGAGFRLPMPWRHILNLGGLKGALSVALILMIPEDYAYRHAFLCAALAMCLFTLVANTLAMRVYLKKAGLEETG
ncbi:MAG: cation:proton antiporter [Verrucomicrobiota bacterium]|nr:cation:proton antiporter [Verrucomicrobiota bacterium]